MGDECSALKCRKHLLATPGLPESTKTDQIQRDGEPRGTLSGDTELQEARMLCVAPQRVAHHHF